MATIGVYDSGIGGLTTLKLLTENFGGNDFLYFADNLAHPFGTKNERELENIVNSGVEKLKNKCDLVVLACNTASTIYKQNDAIKLLPQIPNDTKKLSVACNGVYNRAYKNKKRKNRRHVRACLSR